MTRLTLELSQLDIEPIEIISLPTTPAYDLDQLIPGAVGIKIGLPIAASTCYTPSENCISCCCDFCIHPE